MTSRLWTCEAVGNLQKIGTTITPQMRVTGVGKGASEEEPCREAKKNAVNGSSRNLCETSKMQGVLQMRRCIKTQVMFVMMDLLTGDPERSIEAAKQLISMPTGDRPGVLIKVVDDPGYKLWSKVAAAYVLGFVPLAKTSEHQYVLRKKLADAKSSVRLRTHAAEALGNLRDKGSAEILGERLLDSEESTAVRKWCIFALAELGSSDALQFLSRFGRTHPQGILAQELQSVSN